MISVAPHDTSARLEPTVPTSGSPYVSYLYGYPHKTAYHELSPAVSLREAWAQEERSALFLYLHVPFCEMRCGFCNLFTAVNPDGDLVEAWLKALSRQVSATKNALGEARYARAVLGGGTPTFLTEAQLERTFDLLEHDGMGARLHTIPVGCEVSPATATHERLDVLRRRGVDRVSIGVQSFLPEEAKAAGRPQDPEAVQRALDAIRERTFPVLNIDLIYGIDGQTPESFRASLRTALRWSPEELYLYPLYVRPLTGLGRRDGLREDPAWDAQRLSLYRAGRDLLLEEGYTQVSMRMFRCGPELEGPPYRCQEDGMVGLGVGARSYTQTLHWSTEYAVAHSPVRAIVSAYAEQRDHTYATWGFRLDGEEQRRRYIAMSLLAGKLERSAYRRRFNSTLDLDMPWLSLLSGSGLASDDGESLTLTQAGIERSDAIGPWLYSARVRERMAAWELR